ncbi:DUF6168 family protein [Lutimonas halocynthiae]|uniref:DUF6168 family protein n=1 Tax=Lutimonas halocynthiae TaxID=1446477 RepID=UPI0025B381AE|nr:DUF6168 family protein [Lutimonas halocynthiae]MDN3641939.1 DUF6168 family protein [Lutimonas halocynthiae]
MNSFSKFSVRLLVVLALAFSIHLFVLHQLELPLLDNRIVAAYFLNYILAITIYLTLFLLKTKMSEQLGFLYMGGSFVKFLFFFIFFYPYYKLDGGLDSLEFAAFFVPYLISLIFETLGVIEFLKK